MPSFVVHKKVHWSDGDAAGIAWFANYLGWFEDVEEELYATALGRSRQSVLEGERIGLPRVEAHIRFEAPVPIGTLLRIAVTATIENPRRLRYAFEMTRDSDRVRVARGFVRAACVDADFRPRDLPPIVAEFVDRLATLADAQAAGRAEVPWT
ncbi:MAG: acyl-CoA thioesterase [Vicinamibacterales bacterium]